MNLSISILATKVVSLNIQPVKARNRVVRSVANMLVMRLGRVFRGDFVPGESQTERIAFIVDESSNLAGHLMADRERIHKSVTFTLKFEMPRETAVYKAFVRSSLLVGQQRCPSGQGGVSTLSVLTYHSYSSWFQTVL